MWLTWNVEVLFSFLSNVALFKRLGFLVHSPVISRMHFIYFIKPFPGCYTVVTTLQHYQASQNTSTLPVTQEKSRFTVMKSGLIQRQQTKNSKPAAISKQSPRDQKNPTMKLLLHCG